MATRSLLVLAFLSALIVSGSAYADALILRNGEVLQGTIVSQSRTQVSISIAGQIRIVPKGDVVRLVFGSGDEEIQKQEKLRREESFRQREAERRKIEEERERQRSTDRRLIPLDVLWRSALAPGWGQHYAHRDDQAILVGGIFFGTALVGWEFRKTALAAKRDYDNISTGTKMAAFAGAPAGAALLLDSAAKGAYQTRVERHNRVMNVLGLIYAAQLVHAAFFTGPVARGALVVSAEQRVSVDFLSVDLIAGREEPGGGVHPGPMLGLSVRAVF
ncbi:MAG: hypothetical protein HY042_00795 [Spirochaetia bacterium]|nr:hypothetical protein [Spirochaetia bacterium]